MVSVLSTELAPTFCEEHGKPSRWRGPKALSRRDARAHLPAVVRGGHIPHEYLPGSLFTQTSATGVTTRGIRSHPPPTNATRRSSIFTPGANTLCQNSEPDATTGYRWITGSSPPHCRVVFPAHRARYVPDPTPTALADPRHASATSSSPSRLSHVISIRMSLYQQRPPPIKRVRLHLEHRVREGRGVFVEY